MSRTHASISEDEAVLRAVQADEPGAFDKFVDRFGSRIYSFGVRVCGKHEDAEDVFQETLLAVFRNIQQLREPGALSTWLYRIVSNACFAGRRKGTLSPPRETSIEDLLPVGGVFEDGPHLPAGGVTPPESAAYAAKLSDALEQALEELPKDYRVVWVLRDVEGFSTAETAEILGIKAPNVKMRLHRARLALRKKLEHWRPGEESDHD